MTKWMLLFVLIVSGLMTVATGATVVLDIYGFAARFGIELNVPPETAVAISTFGTPIAASSLFTFLAAYWVLTDHPGGRCVAMVSGLMLVILGISIYFIAGITQLLFIDTFRGLIVMTLSYRYTSPSYIPYRVP
jgi:hypothetical protein